MEQLETATVKTTTPALLATRMGISPKQVRQILRTEHPRDVKHKKWEIPETLAKRVIKNYKTQIKEREAKKQMEIDKQLKGEELQ